MTIAPASRFGEARRLSIPSVHQPSQLLESLSVDELRRLVKATVTFGSSPHPVLLALTGDEFRSLHELDREFKQLFQVKKTLLSSHSDTFLLGKNELRQFYRLPQLQVDQEMSQNRDTHHQLMKAYEKQAKENPVIRTLKDLAVFFKGQIV
jgi:hypothetical protein